MYAKVMGALAKFDWAFLKEGQREGIAIVNKAGDYKGRKQSLTTERVIELPSRCGRPGEKIVCC